MLDIPRVSRKRKSKFPFPMNKEKGFRQRYSDCDSVSLFKQSNRFQDVTCIIPIKQGLGQLYYFNHTHLGQGCLCNGD